MSSSEYFAFASIIKMVNLRCETFFKTLKQSGVVDEDVEYMDCWGNYIDQDKSLEVEIFDRVFNEFDFHIKQHIIQQYKPVAKNAYSHFCEEEKHIIKEEYPNVSEKEVKSKLRDMWRDLSDHNKSLYGERVSADKSYKKMAIEARKKYENDNPPPNPILDPVSTEGIESSLENLHLVSSPQSEAIPAPQGRLSEAIQTEKDEFVEILEKKEKKKKVGTVELKNISVPVEDQYTKGDKKMFRLRHSEGVVEDINQNITKNTLKILQNIMKLAIGVKSVSKYNKESATNMVSAHIIFE
jgi:hypothetical protein